VSITSQFLPCSADTELKLPRTAFETYKGIVETISQNTLLRQLTPDERHELYGKMMTFAQDLQQYLESNDKYKKAEEVENWRKLYIESIS